MSGAAVQSLRGVHSLARSTSLERCAEGSANPIWSLGGSFRRGWRPPAARPCTVRLATSLTGRQLRRWAPLVRSQSQKSRNLQCSLLTSSARPLVAVLFPCLRAALRSHSSHLAFAALAIAYWHLSAPLLSLLRRFKPLSETNTNVSNLSSDPSISSSQASECLCNQSQLASSLSGSPSTPSESLFTPSENSHSPTVLLSSALLLPAAYPGAVSDFCFALRRNPTFMSAFIAWTLAQALKVVTTLYKEGRLDIRKLVASGGMPSSHSSLCVALTTSVALLHGVSGALFPVSLGFSLIVMYDAAGVRLHAGKQAEVLNRMIEDMYEGHPVGEIKLKELLGHTPLQVLGGAAVGLLVALWYPTSRFAIVQ